MGCCQSSFASFKYGGASFSFEGYFIQGSYDGIGQYPDGRIIRGNWTLNSPSQLSIERPGRSGSINYKPHVQSNGNVEVFVEDEAGQTARVRVEATDRSATGIYQFILELDGRLDEVFVQQHPTEYENDEPSTIDGSDSEE